MVAVINLYPCRRCDSASCVLCHDRNTTTSNRDYVGRYFRVVPGTREKVFHHKYHSVNEIFKVEWYMVPDHDTAEEGLQQLHDYFEELIQLVFHENNVKDDDKVKFAFSHVQLIPRFFSAP